MIVKRFTLYLRYLASLFDKVHWLTVLDQPVRANTVKHYIVAAS